MAFKSVEDVVKYIKDENVEYVDVRFTDVPGIEQHFTIPASMFDEDAAEEGLAFDGSSVRGFTTIDESDMNLLPDLATAKIDPFRKAKTLNMKFFVHDPFTREPFSRDPRNVARKAEEYLASTGIADTCFFGAEAEFFVFDSVRYGSGTNHGFYEVDSIAGHWNTGAETEADGSPNLGYKVRAKGGYFPVAPYDHFVDLRNGIYAFEPSDKLDEALLSRAINEIHRRGMLVYGTVNTGVPEAEYDKAVAMFERFIALGADGLWVSFDDKGPGDKPEEIVRRVLEQSGGLLEKLREQVQNVL